ncbi:hypothetical protein, partial [Thiolapillus sp.]
PKPEPTPKQLARLIQERHRRRQAATESCRRRGGKYDKVELNASKAGCFAGSKKMLIFFRQLDYL